MCGRYPSPLTCLGTSLILLPFLSSVFPSLLGISCLLFIRSCDILILASSLGLTSLQANVPFFPCSLLRKNSSRSLQFFSLSLLIPILSSFCPLQWAPLCQSYRQLLSLDITGSLLAAFIELETRSPPVLMTVPSWYPSLDLVPLSSF